jgi:hypothetical protein
MMTVDSSKDVAPEPKIIEREKRMVEGMVLIYCKAHHA